MAPDFAWTLVPALSAEHLLWLISVPVIGVVHELGHALAARPAGYRVTSFGVGHGKPLLRWELRNGVIVYLGRWIISGGLCVAIPIDPVPARRWLYHSGGLLLQAALALALWPLMVLLPALEYAFWFNLVVLGWNLLPVRIGGYATDGWQLVADFIRPDTAGQFFSARREVERVLRFEERIGSPLGETWCRVFLRWMDVVTGLDDDGWRPDDVILISEPQLEALHGYVMAERHRVEGRSLAALSTVHELRRAYGPEFLPVALDMLTVAEARAYLAQDEPRQAQQALARLAGAVGAVSSDACAIEVDAAMLRGDAPEVERAALRLSERLSGSFLDAPEAVRTLWRAAGWLKEEGRIDAAAELGAEARAGAARQIAAAAPSDKVSTAARLGEVAGVELVTRRAGPG
ncbi:MAG: hypothetical protein GY884_28630 [Proteobacteria bacterium]|nr:hypothetical protein [Pseudomonadota bacterium]